jgi:microcystin-dependent protein
VGGEENHTLLILEIPTHSHGINDPGHAHTYAQGGVGGINYAQMTNGNGSNPGTSSATTGISIQNTGGGMAHNNMQPSAVVNYIIKY